MVAKRLTDDVRRCTRGNGQTQVSPEEQHAPRAHSPFDERADREHDRDRAQPLGPQRGQPLANGVMLTALAGRHVGPAAPQREKHGARR